MAGAAASAQKQKTQNGNVFPPAQLAAAMHALASSLGDFHVIVLTPNQAVDETADYRAQNKQQCVNKNCEPLFHNSLFPYIVA